MVERTVCWKADQTAQMKVQQRVDGLAELTVDYLVDTTELMTADHLVLRWVETWVGD